MQIVPLKPVPNQTVVVNLGAQPCTIEVYQTFYRLFVNLAVNDVSLIVGVVAENFNRIVRSKYLGFDGDLMIYDTQGNDTPEWAGLGSRFVLAYLTADEADALGVGA